MKIKTVKDMLFEIIDKKIEDTNIAIVKLNEDDKKDEANLEKVKLNVYDIFRTMYGASEKKVYNPSNKSSEDDKLEEFKLTYLTFFDKIPNNWVISLEKAKVHDDFEKIHIEEIKLETMEYVRSAFLKIWEE